MKVTAIKAQAKNPDRVSVYVDGEYNFSLTQGQLLEARLRVGMELSPADMEKLQDDSQFGKAYMRALDYIMRRPRSEKEMRDYAYKKQWPKSHTEKVIAKLSEKGYLDDAKFARSWTRHRVLGKPMSGRKLRLELRQKGVANEHIEAALLQDEEFDETEALKSLVEKKRHRYEDERKFIAYLMRQGFRYDDIKQALE